MLLLKFPCTIFVQGNFDSLLYYMCAVVYMLDLILVVQCVGFPIVNHSSNYLPLAHSWYCSKHIHYIGSADKLNKHFHTKHDAYRLSVRKKNCLKLFESI